MGEGSERPDGGTRDPEDRGEQPVSPAGSPATRHPDLEDVDLEEATGDIRVLHVDDEPALLEVSEQYLKQEEERIVVETATQAETGLEILDREDVDAVVSDYQMPGMDGLAFLEALRERGEDLPFIIFTGRGREEVAVDALNLGADRYIQKGGDPASQYGLLADAIVQEVRHRQARRELQESEERYRTLVEAFPDIVFITDYESRMLYANPALERQTGLTIEDFQMAQEDNPFIHPDDADRVAQFIGAFVESDEKYSDPVDNRFVDADGNIHWYSSVIAKITYEGEPALQFIVRNITERKQREQRLEEMRRRYETLLANFPAGLVGMFNDNLRYTEVGGDLLEDIRRDPVDIEGQRVTDVNDEVFVDPQVDAYRSVFEAAETVEVDHERENGGGSFLTRLIPVTEDDEVVQGIAVSIPE